MKLINNSWRKHKINHEREGVCISDAKEIMLIYINFKFHFFLNVLIKTFHGLFTSARVCISDTTTITHIANSIYMTMLILIFSARWRAKNTASSHEEKGMIRYWSGLQVSAGLGHCPAKFYLLSDQSFLCMGPDMWPDPFMLVKSPISKNCLFNTFFY